jgi:hypothetical protein
MGLPVWIPLLSVLLLLLNPQAAANQRDPSGSRPPGRAPEEHRWSQEGIVETCQGAFTRVVLQRILGKQGYYFSVLADPPRLVVDILDPLRALPVKEVDLRGRAVRRLRFGRHPDKLRVVYDLAPFIRDEPRVQRNGSDLIVQLGGRAILSRDRPATGREVTAEKPPDGSYAKPVRIEAIRFSQTRKSADVTLHLDGKAPYEVQKQGQGILIELSGAEIAPAQREAFLPRDPLSPILSIEPEQQAGGEGGRARILIRLREKRPFEVVEKETRLCVSVKACEPLPECFLEEPIRSSCRGKPAPWMESLSMMWRQEYLGTYLPGYLFREEGAFHRVASTGSPGEPNPLTPEEPDVEPTCEALCTLGDQYLAAGLLPEALATYKRAVERECQGVSHARDPELGLLKTNLAMGRFLDAKRIFLRLSDQRSGREVPFFRLTDAVLTSFDHKFHRAADLFTDTVPFWHLCRNVEGVAGYALYRQGRYMEARNVFRVARSSPWKDLREFGRLGLADCYWALDRCEEAQKLYEGLAASRSPLGWLALTEFRIRREDFDGALASLGMLRASPLPDYWKGIALAYWMSLKIEQEDWVSALHAAEKDQALVLTREWARYLEKQTVKALAGQVRSLSEAGSHEETLLLAYQWPAYLEKLPFTSQVFLARAYESLGMYRSAAEVYGRFRTDPNSLFQAARLAWRAGEYTRAEALLRSYFATGDAGNREDARMLGVSLLFHLNRPAAAKRYLRGIGVSGDPSLLAAVARVEESLGMVPAAIRHYRAALENTQGPDEERKPLLRKIASLYYEEGAYKKSLSYARRSLGTGARDQSTRTEPIEVLSLLRLEKQDQAKPKSERLRGGVSAKVVKEIVATEDLATTLQRQGYAF